MRYFVRQSLNQMTRKKIANPFADTPMLERLHNANSIDLRNNYIEEPLPNGYVRIIPIDSSKTH